MVHRRSGIVAVTVLVAVAGCSGPAAVATRSQSPLESIAPTPSAPPIPSADPAEGLAIARPYTLVEADPLLAASAESAIRSVLEPVLGTFPVGTRLAKYKNRDEFHAEVVVVGLKGLTTSKLLEDASNVFAQAASATTTKKSILGTPVRVVTASNESDVIFVLGDRLILCILTNQKGELAVARAMIEANAAAS